MEENRKNENPMKQSLFRGIVICIALLVVALIVMWFFNTGRRGTEVDPLDLKEKLSSGTVTRIEFTNDFIVAKYTDGKYYWVHNNFGYGQKLLTDLYDGVYDTTNLKIVVGSAATFNFLNLLYPILSVIALVVLFRWLLRSVGAANRSGLDFVKNRARIMPSKVKFADVAGADEEKAELEEIIEFLKDPDKFSKLGARIPKGVLLVGPPGTGKTLLAKACAGEANVPFFTISGSDFMELYVGVGASRVRDLFETAKKAKPCIIFIDEIDAVGRQRGAGLGGGSDEREQTLNQLLVQMDGFEVNEGIIVLAATNRVDILDPALLRPGRFDRRVYINMPDVKGREEILKVHAKNKPLGGDVNLRNIARITSGFTGADLENMLNEAALFAAKQKQKEIKMEDINNAIAKVTMGPQKRSYVMSEEDKRITAVHESGHAIIGKCIKNNDTIHEVSIVPRGGAGGYTLSRPEKDEKHMMKNKLLATITMMLGGRTAEKLFLYDISTGASNDIERATSIARSMVTEWGMSEKLGLVHFGSDGNEVFIGRDYAKRNEYSETTAAAIDEEVKKILDECSKQAEKILSDNRAKLETMVELLLEKETIYQDEVDMIMQGKTKEEILTEIEKKENAEQKKTIDVDELIKKAEQKEASSAKQKAEKTVEDKAEQPKTAEKKKAPAKRKSTSTKNTEKTEKQSTTKKTNSKVASATKRSATRTTKKEDKAE